MKLTIAHGEIIEYPADVLIYSTNRKLIIGASLRSQYGYQIQQLLYEQKQSGNSLEAKVGDVFEGKLNNMRWSKVLHASATDSDYKTDPSVVKSG